MRSNPLQFARFKIRHNHHLAANELFRLINKRNSGHNGPWFGFADIDLEVKKLLGAFDLLGGFYFANAQVYFAEVVNRNCGRERR